MPYSVIFDKKAIKELKKLEKHLIKRIINKIKQTKKNALQFFKELKGRKDYKLRIGSYRVIADINKRLKRIEITKIGHRRNIYKKT